MSLINTIKTGVTIGLKLAQTHSPVLLAGLAVGTAACAVFAAVKATPKALDDLDEEELEREEKGEPSLNSLPKGKKLWAIIKRCWKRYIWTAILLIITWICIIASYKIQLRRQAAALAAYAMTKQSFDEYKEKAEEIFKAKDRDKHREAMAQESVNKYPQTEANTAKSTTIIGGGDTWFQDSITKRYFQHNIDKVKQAFIELGREQLDTMYVSVNDFYDKVGLERCPDLDDLVFDVNKSGYIDPEYEAAVMPDGRPCLVISYRVAPRFDERSYH